MPAAHEQKQKLGAQIRAAKFVPDSYNEKDNTLEVVFATDAPVMRWGWDGEYNEVLSFEASAVRMERLNQGAPLLNNHRTWGGVENQIGKVERAWIDNGVGKAKLRLSGREDIKGIIQDIREGIISNVSVGYRVYKYEEKRDPAPTAVGERKDTTPTYVAIDWEPYEVSMVTVPADPNAGVRSESEKPNEVIIITNENRAMPEPIIPTPPVAPATPAPQPEGLSVEQKRALEEQAVKAERERVSAIELAGRSAKLDDEFIQQHRNAGTSVDEFRKLAFEELAKRNAQVGNPSANNEPARVTGADPTDKKRASRIDGIMLRGGLVSERDLKPEQVSAAREHRNLRLLDVAKECLSDAGINWRGMNDLEIAKRALTGSSSDFPVLLEGTNRRVLLAAYDLAAKTWRDWCKIGSLGDFREYKRVKQGSLTTLDTLAENAEYKNKSIPDGVYEKISLKTYGNTLGITRQMIINDDLDAFTSLAQQLGDAAALTIETAVYTLLANNPIMNEDNERLFSAAHNNLITTGAGAPSVAQFDKMRVAMKTQKDISKNNYLNIVPTIGLFPVGLYSAATVVNGSEFDATSSAASTTPNAVRNMLKRIIDSPYLADTAYYMFSDKYRPIEVAFLQGQESPFLEMQEQFNFDGIMWKVRHDFGVAAIDYRGAVKNAGA